MVEIGYNGESCNCGFRLIEPSGRWLCSGNEIWRMVLGYSRVCVCATAKVVANRTAKRNCKRLNNWLVDASSMKECDC